MVVVADGLLGKHACVGRTVLRLCAVVNQHSQSSEQTTVQRKLPTRVEKVLKIDNNTCRFATLRRVEMLILKRSKDESIVINTSDGEIRLMITDASGFVGIGVDAPKSCAILREELVSEQALPEVSERTLEQTGSR